MIYFYFKSPKDEFICRLLNTGMEVYEGSSWRWDWSGEIQEMINTEANDPYVMPFETLEEILTVVRNSCEYPGNPRNKGIYEKAKREELKNEKLGE